MYKLKCFEVVHVKLNIFQLDCDCIKIGTRLPFCVSNSEKYNLLKKDYLNFLVTRKNHETIKINVNQNII